MAIAVVSVGCGKTASPVAPAIAPPSSPVPAPDTLVAEVSVRGPDALWGRLQQGVGGPLGHLPQSLGGALATTAKLDLTVAGEIDGAAPAYAVIAHPGSTFSWVAALRLRDVEHARATLLGGKQPRFSGRIADGGLTVLGPPGAGDLHDGASTLPYMLALSPLGYLVVARSEADLVTLAPYATRTLPARPPSAHALIVTVPRAALGGAIREQLTAAVSDLRGTAAALDTSLRKQHGGSVPDLGDPTAVIDGLDDFARQKLTLLADLDRAELALDAGDDDLTAELSLVPGSEVAKKAFAALTTGDASPLLTLSGTTQVALLFRDDVTSLRDGAKTAEERTIAVFKPGLTPKDIAPIHEAFSTWASARGPWLTAGFELEDGPTLALRTPTTDPERAMRGVSELIDLAHVPAFRDMLEAHFSVQGVSTATATVPGVGATSIATFAHTGHGNGPQLAVAWAATGDLLHVAAAGSPAQALRASKDPTSLLGSDIALAGKLGALRDRATFVFAGRRKFGVESGERHPSVVLGLGRDKANGWALLEIDDALVGEGLTRWLDL